MDSSNPAKEASEAGQDKASEVSRETKACEAPTEANKGKKKTVWDIGNFAKDSSDFEEMTTPEQGTSESAPVKAKKAKKAQKRQKSPKKGKTPPGQWQTDKGKQTVVTLIATTSDRRPSHRTTIQTDHET